MTSTTSSHVLVVGGGIIGLQSAVCLLEAGFQVTIVAKHLPGDTSIEYTSPWAGAQWRTHAAEEDAEQCRWDIETYNHWSEVLEEESRNKIPPSARSGLGLYNSCIYWDDPKHPELRNGAQGLWWASKVKDFTILPASKLPKDAAVGVSFTSFTIDVPRNLEYLRQKVEQLGGRVIRGALDTSEGLYAALQQAAKLAADKQSTAKIDAFVNATGLGARELAQDSNMYPVRGQTLLVQGSANRISTRQGVDPITGEKYIAYALPRSDGQKTVLGGCKQKGNCTAGVDEDLTAQILERCKALCPELMGDRARFTVLAAQVGLRPGREGGVRIERETIKQDQEFIEVVHAYGHEGAGYQNSIGCAKNVVKLVRESTSH